MSESRSTANAQLAAEWGAALLILGLAAALRLYQPALVDMRFDEAIALRLARGIAEGHWFGLAPFSGSVVNHPPAYLYAMALPYAFTRAWLAAFVWRVTLDVAAVGMTWWMARRHIGRGAALIAALLFAVAPWAVQMARKTGIVVLPLGSALGVWGLLEVASRRNSWGWALVGWGLVLTLGAHWSGAFALPAVGAVLVTRWRTLRLAPILVGGVPLVALSTAYALHDARLGSPNMQALLSASRETAQCSLDALQRALWLSGGAHLSDLTGPAFTLWQAQPLWALRLVDDAQQLWLGSGVLAALWLAWRQPALRTTALVLLAWWASPILLQACHTQPVQMHYLLLTYPAPFMLMALVWQLAQPHHAARTLLINAVAALTAYHLALTLQFTHFIGTHVTYPGGYGPPVRAALEASQAVRDDLRQGHIREVLILTPGADPNVEGSATVLDVLLADLPRRFANSREGLVLREDGPVAYLLAPEVEDAVPRAARHYAVQHTQAYPLAPSDARAYRYMRASTLRLPADLQPLPAQWARGFGLLGYRAHTSTTTLHLDAYVRIFNAPQEEDVHWFAHLYVGNQRVAQHDVAAVHPSQWRPGDVLLVSFILPLPPLVGNSALHLGAYTYPAIERIPLTDSNGNIIGDTVTIPIALASRTVKQ
ncbi:MAG: hypothetical protein RMJ86_04070 [Anaerolineae bacterium]|nr:hypothetical protein [Anaerolineae bacterium]